MKALYHQPGVASAQSFDVAKQYDGKVDLADDTGKVRITGCPVADKPTPGFATLVPDAVPSQDRAKLLGALARATQAAAASDKAAKAKPEDTALAEAAALAAKAMVEAQEALDELDNPSPETKS